MSFSTPQSAQEELLTLRGEFSVKAYQESEQCDKRDIKPEGHKWHKPDPDDNLTFTVADLLKAGCYPTDNVWQFLLTRLPAIQAALEVRQCARLARCIEPFRYVGFSKAKAFDALVYAAIAAWDRCFYMTPEYLSIFDVVAATEIACKSNPDAVAHWLEGKTYSCLRDLEEMLTLDFSDRDVFWKWAVAPAKEGAA